MPSPGTQYAKSDSVHLAYQVTGSGPFDLVMVPGFVSHLEHEWEHPWVARYLERLGSFSRLIRFDKRGTGLSDRVRRRRVWRVLRTVSRSAVHDRSR
jgi:pimeloyl-ACP methyl ester carboxylesterase